MKSTYLLVGLTALLFAACTAPQTPSEEMILTDGWQFRQAGESQWLDATVPGTVHTDLLAQGKIEDPYYRLNEHDQQWIDKEDWEYQTEFDVPGSLLDKGQVVLDFAGLDTYADVYLNGSLILQADNMFRAWQVPVKDLLKSQGNQLRVLLRSPIQEGLAAYDSLDYIIPVSDNDNSTLGGVGEKRVSIFTRKAGYHFGWDWGPRLVSSGIWRPITLRGWEALALTDVFVKQNSLTDAKAELSAQVTIDVKEASEVTVEVVVADEVKAKQITSLEPGEQLLTLPFALENPQRWWPNVLGDPYRYPVTVRVSRNGQVWDEETKQVGLRTLEIIREPDSVGMSFTVAVNGQPVFMKGANYIPLDVFVPRVSDGQYEHALRSARDANMNMVRVWGGGIYENEIFYELCDQYGLLVWQDFMFACAMFPGDEAFLANVKAEAEYNVKRLRQHPSIALWCGNNEVLSAWKRWGWEGQMEETYGAEVKDKVWKAYDDIFHNILPEAVAAHDPDRFYWASSPQVDEGVPEEMHSGDAHYWMVWWGKQPFESYQEAIPRFMSEFGFQSFPDITTVKRYTEEEDWSIYSEVMQSHQRSSIGNVTIAEYMERDYRDPKNFEMFLYVNHVLQAEGIKMGIEGHRKAMPYCMGSLYWQLNDVWPVASWSGMDYFGRWKALHYFVRDAFQEVAVMPDVAGDQLAVTVVSDRWEEIPAKIRLRALDFAGQVLGTVDVDYTIPANTSAVATELPLSDLGLVDLPNQQAQVVIAVEVLDAKGALLADNLKYLVKPKDLDLPEVSAELSVTMEEPGKATLTLTASTLAKHVYLQTSVPGHFSDNYFDLLPGETATVSFQTTAPVADTESSLSFSVVSLVDSYEK